MKLTVKDCMKLDAFQFAKVLAGEDKLGSPIRSISVMDAGDVKTAVSTNGVEGQLVLTSFYAMKDAGKRADTVKRLAKCGISAMVVFHADGDLSPSDKLVQAAREEDLPLILIPDETHSSTVFSALCSVCSLNLFKSERVNIPLDIHSLTPAS